MDKLIDMKYIFICGVLLSLFTNSPVYSQTSGEISKKDSATPKPKPTPKPPPPITVPGNGDGGGRFKQNDKKVTSTDVRFDKRSIIKSKGQKKER